MGSLPDFELPVLDASNFTSQDPTNRTDFANKLHDALKNHGFVKLVNHGISEDDVSELFAQSRRFFNLSLDIKRGIEHKPGLDPQRGWSCVGSENTAKLFSASSRSSGDVTTCAKTDGKEHFDIGSPTDVAFPNRWPPESDTADLRPFLENIFDRLHVISSQLLEALELSLQVSPGTFTNRCKHQADELRLNHYPPRTQQLQSCVDEDAINRAWPHTDLGVLTCLFQDSVGGLEIEDRLQEGKFRAVQPGKGNELVVNVSETLERWTNGKLLAGLHRVTSPPASAPALGSAQVFLPERFSIPFFLKADRDASVGPISQFIDLNSQTAYPKMTAIEFHRSRLAAAY